MIKNKKIKLKYSDRKYKLDEHITINNQQWRIAEYRFKYGREWVYILQHENVDGMFKTLEFNEKTLTAIIESGSDAVFKTE